MPWGKRKSRRIWFAKSKRLLCAGKIKPAAGLMFKRSQVTQVWPPNAIPNDIVSIVRRWDLAATEVKTVENRAKKKDAGLPDYSAGVLLGKRANGRYIILDVQNVHEKASDVRQRIKNTAQADRASRGMVKTVVPQDPGQAGKDQAEGYVKLLAGFAVGTDRETGTKVVRATPFASQWQAGNVEIVEAPWNEMLYNQFEQFPDGAHDDMVDAASGAFNEIERGLFDLGALTK
jgi:predicted phage terminase large subunit-like protein